MSDYFLYLIVRVISFILGLLPLKFSLWAGRRLGDLAFYLKKSRRKVALTNLKAALGQDYTYAQLEAIAKKTFHNLGQTLLELMNFPRMNNDHYINKYVTFENLNRIDEGLKKGQGVILLTAHFGNWELSSFATAHKGYRMKVFAREQKYERLNQLLNRYRQLSGCRVIPKGMALRDLIRALHNNEIIGMVGDQNAGPSGVPVNFFNRLASTANGAMEVALKTKAVVLPGFIIREKNIYHRIVIEKPLDLEDTGDINLDIKNALGKFNALLEKYIIEHPEQWLWVHKRWKKTPNRSIVILSDGKTGHWRQSEAVLKIAQTVSRPDLITVKVIEIKFINKLARFFLPLFTILGNFNLLGAELYLRWAMPKKTFLELKKTFSDVIISCGSSLSLINLWLSRENNAKSVVIMKPSLISLKKFDLAIVPAHDRAKKLENTVITFGSPTNIEPNDLLKKGQQLKDKLGLSEKRKIGLLLGGDNKRYYFKKEDVGRLIDEIIEISTSRHLGLLVTTSRRTPKEIENLLKERLGSFKNCELLVIASENNFPGAVEGILALSQALVVSSESVSMLCEAVSSGKPVVAFEPKLKRALFPFGGNKQKVLLTQLINEGYVLGSKISDLGQIFDYKKSARPLDNKNVILSGLRRIW